MTRTWLITGSSTGFGRSLAEAALLAGDRVVATARDPRSLVNLPDPHGLLLPVALDVTDPAARAAAVAAAEDAGGIDVLVNNAGRGRMGAFEELSDADIESMFDINVFAPIALARAALPAMRARRRGHIVQMSSVAGTVAIPGHGLYAATKAALDGASAALANEIEPFGIHVTIVQPGPFRTRFAGTSMTYADPLDAYCDTPAATWRHRMAEQDGRQPGDPARAAEVILRAVASPVPPLRLPLGADTQDRIRTELTGRLADMAALDPSTRDTDHR